ncbi:unnamed protein product [Schistosoma mattheei]|uniref:Uncharacterized protein n=1 Tax=Schistosoma mattheei TaxID=31246 RepID=A0A183PZH0_9TREM|nr:unnamed protein product [Schistosoma mattheei]
MSSYLGLVSWVYLHLRVDVHSATQTQYWLAVESSLTRVSSYLGLVSRMCLHRKVVVHSGTQTQYSSIQTPSR